MISGDSSIFAIESSITLAYERLSFRALGFFVIHVAGLCYGKRSPDNTMLACSYDAVNRRVALRGSHTTSFASEPDAGKIAGAFRNAIYGEKQQESYCGIRLVEFTEIIHSNHIVWAPDGDEAFDDGSYVLQFDVGERVRLIAFKSMEKDLLHDPATLGDVWLPADDFYRILQGWSDAFVAEWESMPKASDAGIDN